MNPLRAIVTGGAANIGRAITEAFLARGRRGAGAEKARARGRAGGTAGGRSLRDAPLLTPRVGGLAGGRAAERGKTLVRFSHWPAAESRDPKAVRLGGIAAVARRV